MSNMRFHLSGEFKALLVLVPVVLIIGVTHVFWPGDDAAVAQADEGNAPKVALHEAEPADDHTPLSARKPTFAEKIREKQAVSGQNEGTTNETVPAAPAPEDEGEAFMVALRGLWFGNPEEGLTLAKEGEQRFKDSPRASECAWIAVRCVVEMGDFPKARKMAEKMQETYPQTHWALDVKRHLLVRPPDK